LIVLIADSLNNYEFQELLIIRVYIFVSAHNMISRIHKRRVAEDIITTSVIQKIIGRLQHIVANCVVNPNFLFHPSGEAMLPQRWTFVSLEERRNL